MEGWGWVVFREEVYGISEIPIEIDPVRVSLFVGLTFVCTVLFALAASVRAARITPVRALRRD